jgi:hypothetical protein
MNRQVVSQLVLFCLAGLLPFSCCNKGTYPYATNTINDKDTESDSTAYVIKGDSILPPLRYKLEEMGDFNFRKGVPLRVTFSSRLIILGTRNICTF